MYKNIIYNDANENMIGYYKDLNKELTNELKDFAEEQNWEMVQDITGLLTELTDWADNKNLLVISTNNGMGYTIKEYEKGD